MAVKTSGSTPIRTVSPGVNLSLGAPAGVLSCPRDVPATTSVEEIKKHFLCDNTRLQVLNLLQNKHLIYHVY